MAEAIPGETIFQEGVTQEILATYIEAQQALIALSQQSEGQGRSAPESFDIQQQRSVVQSLYSRIFKECTEVGPPSPIHMGQDGDGGLVWVCSHDPQHLYDFETGELLP